MHGAGVIEAIEDREVLGEKQQYYVVNIPMGKMQVLVPTAKVSDIGIREIIGGNEAKDVLEHMRKREEVEGLNWNRRYRSNLDKIKTGDIYEVADVVRALMVREHTKGLSAGERKMLDNARQMLISELALASEMSEEQILDLLVKVITEQDNFAPDVDNEKHIPANEDVDVN
ncbi:MAG: hypothetical protein RLZ12_907 [Bacillota bacterium]|jgi:CarD family transcriptional regulator